MTNRFKEFVLKGITSLLVFSQSTPPASFPSHISFRVNLWCAALPRVSKIRGWVRVWHQHFQYVLCTSVSFCVRMIQSGQCATRTHVVLLLQAQQICFIYCGSVFVYVKQAHVFSLPFFCAFASSIRAHARTNTHTHTHPISELNFLWLLSKVLMIAWRNLI